MSQIFISHVEEDESVALEIANGLEAAGHSTWYYERDSLPGLSYLDQIDEAIEQSQAVVVIISLHSLSSWQVDKEVERSHESGKHFVPILRGVKHVEFQARKRGWRMAMGASTSISIPAGGASTIVPRIVAGLGRLGVNSEKSFDIPISRERVAARTDRTIRSIPALLRRVKTRGALIVLAVLVFLGFAFYGLSKFNLRQWVTNSNQAQSKKTEPSPGGSGQSSARPTEQPAPSKNEPVLSVSGTTWKWEDFNDEVYFLPDGVVRVSYMRPYDAGRWKQNGNAIKFDITEFTQDGDFRGLWGTWEMAVSADEMKGTQFRSNQKISRRLIKVH